MRPNWLRDLERLGVPASPALRAFLSIQAHTNPSLTQAGFRLRNDDGSETTATWKAAENTNATIAVDENFRVRFVVDETAGGAENVQFKIQYNLNGAGWNDVLGPLSAAAVRTFSSPNFAEGDATTRQLASGTGTFLAGKMDESDGATNVNTAFTSQEITEHEFCCQINSAQVVNADSIQLRLVRSTGVVLEAYAQTPTITVSEAAATPSGTGSISGGGTLAGIGVALLFATGLLAGGGALSGIGQAVHGGTGAISGGGVLAGTGQAVHAGTGSLSGGGTLAGIGAAPGVAASGTGLLSGGGVLAGVGAAIHIGTGTLPGGGTLTGVGENGEQQQSYGWLRRLRAMNGVRALRR